jgi:hypothetical protein
MRRRDIAILTLCVLTTGSMAQPLVVRKSVSSTAIPVNSASGQEYLLEKGKNYSSSYWNVNDGKGYRWDIYSQNGYVNSGSNSAYSTSMYLYMNNNNFYSNSRKVSEDGNELQIGPWNYNNMRVWRRIYIDKKVGYCRWIDIFQNTSGSNQTVSVRYNLNAGSSIKEIYTTRGDDKLTKKDWGCVTRTSNDYQPSLVHIWTSRGSKVKPSFSYSTGNNSMQYNMSFSVKAGKTVALCFFEAQRKPYSEAKKFIKGGFSLSREMSKIPRPLRKIIINFSGPTATIGSLELPRHDKHDLAVTLGKNEFLGEILNETYEIGTFYGKLTLDESRVIGLSVPDVNDDHVQLGLVDGQVVGGKLLNGPLKLKLTTGSVMSLPTSKLRTIAYRVSKEKPSEIIASKPAIVLRSGQQLFFRPTDGNVQYLSEYGQWQLNSENLRGLQFDTQDGGLHRVLFRNGSVLSGLVVDDTLNLKLDLDKTLRIKRHLAKRFVFSGSQIDNTPLATLTLRNEDLLFGTIAEEQLNLKTTFGDAPVKPEQIKTITFLPRPIGKVKVVLKSGSTVEGRFPEGKKTLAFQIEPGPKLDIYLGHITQIDVPKEYGREDEEPADPNTPTSDDAKEDDADSEESATVTDLRKKIAERKAMIEDNQKSLTKMQAVLAKIKVNGNAKKKIEAQQAKLKESIAAQQEIIDALQARLEAQLEKREQAKTAEDEDASARVKARKERTARVRLRGRGG